MKKGLKVLNGVLIGTSVLLAGSCATILLYSRYHISQDKKDHTLIEQNSDNDLYDNSKEAYIPNGSEMENVPESSDEEHITADLNDENVLEALSMEQVYDMLCDKFSLTEDNLLYYGELDINGEPYYGFEVIEAGEGAWESLLVYNRNTNKEYFYDVLGNISEVEKDKFAGLSENIAGDSNYATGGSAYTGQDIALNDGKFVLQGIYNGMIFDEAVRQVALNNNININLPDYTSGLYGETQSGDSFEGDDMITVSEQNVFNCRCMIYLNFDKNLESEYSYATEPVLERIYCLFYQGQDTGQTIKSTCISSFGEPTKIYTSEESGIEYGYEWMIENGDWMTIWYNYTDDGQLAIYQIVITSNAYIEKREALLREYENLTGE